MLVLQQAAVAGSKAARISNPVPLWGGNEGPRARNALAPKVPPEMVRIMRTDTFLILAVGLTPELCALAADGARTHWRHTELLEFRSLDEIEDHPRHAAESAALVLGPGVPEAERTNAVAALGPDSLPRWPVIVFEDGPAVNGLWHVPAALETVPGIAFVLQAAVAHHAVVRDCRRAQGDLWTIARRISHEIRSPIGCILTSADVIREEMEDLVPAAGELAQPVTDSAKEVMELVERLTTVARASAARPVLVPVDMGMVVWAARERLASRIDETHAEVHESTDWPAAHGRPEWLEQVWLNLLGNALRHAGSRPRIELGWRKRDGEILYYVRDHGPGVPADLIPTLLRPFHMLHQADSGRGLGLALVQRLVELQGGRTGYEPVAPHGSLFYFTLPVTNSRTPL